jgi:hypothetical protein
MYKCKKLVSASTRDIKKGKKQEKLEEAFTTQRVKLNVNYSNATDDVIMEMANMICKYSKLRLH